jgi:hypothetical protein
MTKTILVKPQTASQKARMKSRNRAFARLSPEKQRVRIAKDVIEQLADGLLIPASTYFYFGNRREYGADFDLSAIRDPQKCDLSHLTARVPCTVCGIGSLFVAAVKRADKLKWTGCGLPRFTITSYLGEYFTERQLDKIENWYECSGYCEFCPDGSCYNWGDWGEKTPRVRMKKIMQDIVKNKGEFIPLKSWVEREG